MKYLFLIKVKYINTQNHERTLKYTLSISNKEASGK